MWVCGMAGQVVVLPHTVCPQVPGGQAVLSEVQSMHGASWFYKLITDINVN